MIKSLVLLLLSACAFGATDRSPDPAVTLRLKEASPGANIITLKTPTFGSDYNFVFPTTAGTLGQVLTATDSLGNYTWSTPLPAGANVNLSNLGTTSISQDLISSNDVGYNLGSSSVNWSNVYAQIFRYGSGYFNWANGQITDPAGNWAINVSSRALQSETSTDMFDWTTDGVLDAKSNRITNLATPSGTLDAANKNYVDNFLSASSPLAYSSGTVSLSGTVGVAQGGTGLGAIVSDGNFLMNVGGAYTSGTIAAGANITVGNSSGTFTISASSPGAGTYTMVSTGTTATADFGQHIVTSGSISINLPSASGRDGESLVIEKGDSGYSNIVSIVRSGTDTINGAAADTSLNSKDEIITLTVNGTNWLGRRNIPPDYTSAGTVTFAGTGAASAPTKGTIDVDQWFYWREGCHLAYNILYSQTGGGSGGTSTTYVIGLPAGIAADTSVHQTHSGSTASNRQKSMAKVGQADNYRGDVGYTAGLSFLYDSTNIAWTSANVNVGNGNVGVTNTNMAYKLDGKIKIANWKCD